MDFIISIEINFIAFKKRKDVNKARKNELKKKGFRSSSVWKMMIARWTSEMSGKVTEKSPIRDKNFCENTK